MRQEGALWSSAPGLTGTEQAEALCLLDESQRLLTYILAGVALQYHSLDLERQQLLGQGGECAHNVQVAASLITLGALFGFQNQAERLANQTVQAGGESDMMDVKLGATSILISLIRIFRLMNPQQEPNARAQELEELELATEPVV